LLKKLPEKHKDPGRFLISCDFQGLELCMALTDLGASINLMPLSVWKKLSLPNLTSTRMTLELATRSYAYSAGIVKDVFVQVGKFTFPADFVVVVYDVNPRVPLILGRSILRTARALVDVHREELILRDGDEQLIFHTDSTSKHPHKHGNESINMINFIDITCEDRFLEVLKFKKSNRPSSGNTIPFSDSSPSLTPFEISDSLLEEFANELTLLDPIPPGKEDNNFDFEADLREIKFLLHQDPSTESNIETINPILEKLTEELTLDYLPPLGDDDDVEKDKNKYSKMKSLFVEAHIVELNNLLPQNKDKVFNPGILILGRTQILKDESKDKDLILENRNFLSISSDKELLLFLELIVIETLLSFSSENEDKVFNPTILISNGSHYFILELSHWTYETFKIINIHPNIFNSGRVKQDTRTKISASRITLEYEDSRARGFAHHSFELKSLAYGNPIS
nr:reverse transcriptase domain-containing protein [Tanacetum cinerariifolium]